MRPNTTAPFPQPPARGTVCAWPTLRGLVLGERVRTLAAFFALGGVIGLGTLALGSWPSTGRLLTLAASLMALGGALILFRGGERIGVGWLHAFLLLGNVLVGLSQVVAGGPAAAAVAGRLHVFVAVYATLYFSPVTAVPHLLAFVAVQALSVVLVGSAGDADPSGLWAHLYSVTGTTLGIAFVVRRLFHGQARLATQLHEQTLTDALTGLPNRTALRNHLEAFRPGDPADRCLLLVDIADFREINDALGADVGDAVLRVLADRLRRVAGDELLVRIGTDQFGILLEDVSVNAEVLGLRLAGRIRSSVRASFEVEGLALPVDVSVGIAVGTTSTGFEDLLRQAEMAVRGAKREPTGVATVRHVPARYTPERLQLLAELRTVLEGEAPEDVGRLVPWFQPQVDVASGRIVGAEALVRWEHPVRGLVSPDEFVPLAEQTGLVRELTRFMLATSIRACAEWQQDGHEVAVAVNVSARDLTDTSLPDLVADLLDRAGLDPCRLTLEVTETAIMADADLAVTVLERVRAHGVGVALDDFGTGWSSLAHLRRLPLTELKIDRSFVEELLAGDEAATIVGTVVMLARSLGLRVVAEGVEDAATHARLQLMRCTLAQGWHYGGAVPATKLAACLAPPAGQCPATTPDSKSTASTPAGGSGREK